MSEENNEKINCVNLNIEIVRLLGFSIREDCNQCFLSFDGTPSRKQIEGLLALLTENEQLFFWNFYHRTMSDPGSFVYAYVIDGKAIIKEANHGWSGSYYFISIDDLIELIIRNWDKDFDNQQRFRDAIVIMKSIRPNEIIAQMKKGMDVFVPDYSVTAW